MYVDDSMGHPFVDSIVSVYLLSLGEFASMDGYKDGVNRQSAWAMFLLATVIV